MGKYTYIMSEIISQREIKEEWSLLDGIFRKVLTQIVTLAHAKGCRPDGSAKCQLCAYAMPQCAELDLLGHRGDRPNVVPNAKVGVEEQSEWKQQPVLQVEEQEFTAARII